MKTYFQTLKDFKARGGSNKSTTITPQQVLPAIVTHMEHMDKQFTIHVNGHLQKSIDELLNEAFEQSHLQQPFYTQHCEHRSYRYRNLSKKRVKIDFTIRYRMNREQEKWILEEIQKILAEIIHPKMETLEKILAVHDYIIRTYNYDKHTEGSPYAVYTFMKEKHGVCMAYALLFEKMLEQLQIPCYYVIGNADGEGDSGHAWNMVELDGQWYHIDATWDDIGSKHHARQIRYRYFLCNDDDMKKDHQWNFHHYPPCTSNRFTALHALYDVAIASKMLYFPHPTNARLYELNLAKEPFKLKKRLEDRVQFCMYQDGAMYFSNYSYGGYLYRIDIETQKLCKICEAQVSQIKKIDSGLEITYLNRDKEIIEKTDNYQNKVEKALNEMVDPTVSFENTTDIPFIQFDQSWMASYEQTNDTKPLKFISAAGIELVLVDQLKQVTVDIYIDKGLHVRITSNRKTVNLTKPAQLKIAKNLLPNNLVQVEQRLPSGELVAADCLINQETVLINLNKSTSFIF